MYSGAYAVYINGLSVSTAKTLVQIKAGSLRAVCLVRGWLAQSTSTSSGQLRIQLNRKTTAATVTSFTPIKLAPGAGAADAVGGTSATGTNATSEGTDGEILLPDVCNVLTGWLWVPTPEDRIIVPAGGIVALKLPSAPPDPPMTFSGGLMFMEIG